MRASTARVDTDSTIAVIPTGFWALRDGICATRFGEVGCRTFYSLDALSSVDGGRCLTAGRFERAVRAYSLPTGRLARRRTAYSRLITYTVSQREVTSSAMEAS